MSVTLRRSGVALVLLGLGCGAAEAPAPAAVSAAAATPTLDLVFSAHGIPGPWWRRGATRTDFDTDLGGCVATSRTAREGAAGDDRQDAAYRAFLGCMESRAWTRGAPPRPGAGGAAIGG